MGHQEIRAKTEGRIHPCNKEHQPKCTEQTHLPPLTTGLVLASHGPSLTNGPVQYSAASPRWLLNMYIWLVYFDM